MKRWIYGTEDNGAVGQILIIVRLVAYLRLRLCEGEEKRTILAFKVVSVAYCVISMEKPSVDGCKQRSWKRARKNKDTESQGKVGELQMDDVMKVMSN